MSEQKPPRSIKREARKRLESDDTEDQMPAKRSSKAIRSQRVMKRRRRSSLRAGLAVMGGRAAGALSRRLHLGGGTSIAGIVAQRLYPDIVGHLSTQLAHGSVLVTGTNGKTTTSGFIAAILSDAGLRVWRNREGSNLMQGVAGALVIRAQPDGNLRRAGQAISIFEVDEAVMPQAVEILPPRVAVSPIFFATNLTALVRLTRFPHVGSRRLICCQKVRPWSLMPMILLQLILVSFSQGRWYSSVSMILRLI